MATASQQQHQQHPPPSQTPSHEHSHTASETDPWDGDNGDRMFNIYIWDYCNKRGYKKTCQDLQEEAKLGNEFHPPIDAKQGLLYECVLLPFFRLVQSSLTRISLSYVFSGRSSIVIFISTDAAYNTSPFDVLLAHESCSKMVECVLGAFWS
ncbi:hypothetical protein SCHPADRAFT_941990 [Schizopora paradoxa]|uniref:Uncharacterized protein n=1 Tax=Schizopora paradoxa TaxID=27342 RepID=A0A0H2S3I0_9AGAM|nr:hypothetical protein SCHPADRAFT_941990 [Schizopora paradoxa]